MTHERSSPRAPLGQRARDELARAQELQLTGARAVAAGAFVGLVAIVLKGLTNQIADGETGYILLVAAAILASWFGGYLAGLTATLVSFLVNSAMFVDAYGDPLGGDPVSLARQVLFVVTCVGSVLLVSSRRASRDRLERALEEVSTLAEAIESRDRRLELMLAASGTGFWEWDLRTGVLEWSDAIFAQHGRDPADGAPDFETYLGVIHQDDRETFASAIAATAAGAGGFDLEFRLLWPDGSVHWTHGAGRLFRDRAGEPVRMVGTGQDITERKTLEEQRDRLIAEERRAAEFREAFIDVISHELRTPITTILGATEILSRPDRVQDPQVRATILADARAESERLYRLVEDLVVLGRVERGRLVVDVEPLELRRLLERCVAQLRAELPSIDIVLAIPAALPIVSGEATYVEQILRNLLENAAKYSPAGTTVIVAVAADGPDVIVSVTDSGPGVSDDALPHLFELFFRDPGASRMASGSGIGLFICKHLAEAMGGRMEAHRRPEGGSVFAFSLPVLAADEDPLAVESAEA